MTRVLRGPCCHPPGPFGSRLSPFWVRSLSEAPRFPSAALDEAYTICSVAGDLKINETVDLPNWPVSMTLPRGIFT